MWFVEYWSFKLVNLGTVQYNSPNLSLEGTVDVTWIISPIPYSCQNNLCWIDLVTFVTSGLNDFLSFQNLKTDTKLIGLFIPLQVEVKGCSICSFWNLGSNMFLTRKYMPFSTWKSSFNTNRKSPWCTQSQLSYHMGRENSFLVSFANSLENNDWMELCGSMKHIYIYCQPSL